MGKAKGLLEETKTGLCGTRDPGPPTPCARTSQTTQDPQCDLDKEENKDHNPDARVDRGVGWGGKHGPSQDGGDDDGDGQGALDKTMDQSVGGNGTLIPLDPSFPKLRKGKCGAYGGEDEKGDLDGREEGR